MFTPPPGETPELGGLDGGDETSPGADSRAYGMSRDRRGSIKSIRPALVPEAADASFVSDDDVAGALAGIRQNIDAGVWSPDPDESGAEEPGLRRSTSWTGNRTPSNTVGLAAGMEMGYGIFEGEGE